MRAVSPQRPWYYGGSRCASETADISRSPKVVARSVCFNRRERPCRGKAATATALSTIWHKSTQCSTLRELRPPLSPYCLPSFCFLIPFFLSLSFPSSTRPHRGCRTRGGSAIRTDLPIINSTRPNVTRRLLFFFFFLALISIPSPSLPSSSLLRVSSLGVVCSFFCREDSIVYGTPSEYNRSGISPMKG